MEHRRIALVLGGGGMKGFAHIGVLRALEEAGVRPTCFAGTSIGALIAAAYVGGMSLDEMERRALALRKRDLFRINHVGMLLERMRSPSIYLEEPLRALCSNAIPPRHVRRAVRRRCSSTRWTSSAERRSSGDCLVSRTFASMMRCMRRARCLDSFRPGGSMVDCASTAARSTTCRSAIAAQHADAVIAVDVGSSDLSHNTDASAQGFAATYMRAATVDDARTPGRAAQ